ncbi:MAG: diadenylate cyclase [Chloroflexota bacterium]|nr:diadenylate cyclase [Chloroflexota bacterium]
MLQTLFRDLVVFLQGRTVPDVIDIALVAFIAYRVLLLIRGTRAVQLIAGVAVLAVVGIVANALHLTLTSFIFRNLAPALLIGVVILFQPELRRAIDRVGRVGPLGRPLAHYSLQLMSRLVDQVVTGVERLSEQRVGVLLAFERSIGLENYALTGVRLNAEVTTELLQTVFFPRSPLHDGAAIVRGNQIVAAGCLLPMNEDMAMTGRVGTRHRAALSLSLESDAVVVVVSEETGSISVAQDGNLRKVEAEALRQILHNALGRPETSRLPRLFGRRRTDVPGAAVAPPEPDGAEVKAAARERVLSRRRRATDHEPAEAPPEEKEPIVKEEPIVEEVSVVEKEPAPEVAR